MTDAIHFGPDWIRIDRHGTQMHVRRDDIRAVSVYAVDTVIDGVVRFLTVDYENGDFLEWQDRDDVWSALVERLPSVLGFERSSLDRALDRADPDDGPIIVFER